MKNLSSFFLVIGFSIFLGCASEKNYSRVEKKLDENLPAQEITDTTFCPDKCYQDYQSSVRRCEKRTPRKSDLREECLNSVQSKYVRCYGSCK